MSTLQPSQLTFGNLSDAGASGNSFNQYQIGTLSTGQTPAPASPVPNVAPSVEVAAPSTPNTAGTGQTGGTGNFWSRDGGAGLILGGVQVLGNLWNSYQAHKMAKEQMSFAREQWDTNLANQTQTYNTALENRIRGRHAWSGASEAETQSEIERHSL